MPHWHWAAEPRRPTSLWSGRSWLSLLLLCWNGQTVSSSGSMSSWFFWFWAEKALVMWRRCPAVQSDEQLLFEQSEYELLCPNFVYLLGQKHSRSRRVQNTQQASCCTRRSPSCFEPLSISVWRSWTAAGVRVRQVHVSCLHQKLQRPPWDATCSRLDLKHHEIRRSGFSRFIRLSQQCSSVFVHWSPLTQLISSILINCLGRMSRHQRLSRLRGDHQSVAPAPVGFHRGRLWVPYRFVFIASPEAHYSRGNIHFKFYANDMQMNSISHFSVVLSAGPKKNLKL